MFEYDVFISYSHKDKSIVHALANRLKQDGLHVWLDDWVIKPGESIPLKIHQGLDSSTKVLVCMSPSYFGSDWGWTEHLTQLFDDPMNKQGRLVPLLIEDCTRPKLIAHLAYIDWRTCSDDEYTEILTYCRENNSERSSTNLVEQKLREEDGRKEEKEALQRKIFEEEKVRREKEELQKQIEEEKIIRSREETLKKRKSENTEIPKTYTSPSIGMEFILIPTGEFIIGAKDLLGVKKCLLSGRLAGCDGVPMHKVTIKNPFYLGKYPVTQRQWITIMGYNPSSYKGEDQPVENVSWDNVQEFIKKLNKKEDSDKYRLPSEAEWEYACKAGRQTRYSFGDDKSKLDNYAWYSGNAIFGTRAVGQKKPNPWVLYDLHGNVWEWCQDCWHDNYDGAPSDGSAWEDIYTSEERVLRGGSARFASNVCTSAFRTKGEKERANSYNLQGFRLLRTL